MVIHTYNNIYIIYLFLLFKPHQRLEKSQHVRQDHPNRHPCPRHNPNPRRHQNRRRVELGTIEELSNETQNYLANVQVGDDLIHRVQEIDTQLRALRNRLENEVAGLPTSPEWSRRLRDKLDEALQHLQGVTTVTHLAETWGWVQSAYLALHEVLADIQRDWQPDVLADEVQTRGFLAPFFELVKQFAKDTQERLASEVRNAESTQHTLENSRDINLDCSEIFKASQRFGDVNERSITAARNRY
ncbi:hypothetical protein BJX70DRAFT_403816 [Aspergillus crustosus]